MYQTLHVKITENVRAREGGAKCLENQYNKYNMVFYLVEFIVGQNLWEGFNDDAIEICKFLSIIYS